MEMYVAGINLLLCWGDQEVGTAITWEKKNKQKNLQSGGCPYVSSYGSWVGVKAP